MKPLLAILLSLLLTVAVVSAAAGPHFRQIGTPPSEDDPMTGLAALVFVMLWLAFYYAIMLVPWYA